MTARWLVRLLLAAILFFGSEILLWSNPLERPFVEWALIIPGYILLAALLLEIMVRFKIRDLFGLMSLAGMYGLLNGLIINPQTALFEVPRTIATRAMGGHSLLGLEMLIFFLALTGGYIRSLRWALVFGAAAVGLAWGTWVRWSPELMEVNYGVASLETMLGVGAAGILVIFILLQLAYRRAANITPEGILLTNREWMVLTPVFCGLIFIRLLQNLVNGPAVVILLLVLIVNGAILWFRRETTFPSMLVYHLPIRPLRLMWLILSVAILFWTGLFTYSLLLLNPDGFNQLSFVVLGFNIYGVSWLPFISMVLGIRSYARQVQSRPL